MTSIFEPFFETGTEENKSPFLKKRARSWSANLTLKASFLAAIFLVLSFITSFHTYTLPFSYFFLLFVYFIAGIPSLIEAIYDLMNFKVNIDILMTLAAFSSVFIGNGLEGGLLLVLFAFSGSLEDAVSLKAKNTIQSLHKLSPTKATLLTPQGTLKEVPISDIRRHDKIVIKASQIIPLDGLIIEGSSSVNLMHLTGENLPIPKKIGDIIEAGARNLEGTLTIEVTHTSQDSTLAKIMTLITEAQEAKPKIQRFFDRFSNAYALSIIGLSSLFALIFPFTLYIPFLGINGSIYRALTFLITASPCALIIALPIAYLSALSAAAKKGILFKGGVVLDALRTCTTIAFDKTGTLTQGKLKFIDLIPLEEDIHEAFSMIYTLEMRVIHPMAQAIVDIGKRTKKNILPLGHFHAEPGLGISGEINKKKIFLGSFFFIAHHLNTSQKTLLLDKKKTYAEQGYLLSYALIDQHPFLLLFRDTLRAKVFETIQSLKKKWLLRPVILTGDSYIHAKKIANSIGIDTVLAELSPKQKLTFIQETSAHENLVMVGDGVNDAPALAGATVGICMGRGGSTAAIDASDIILLQDKIEQLPWLFSKAHSTHRIIWQNLTFALGAIFLTSIPALLGDIPLWLAVILHEGGTVLVGLNALRLLRPS